MTQMLLMTVGVHALATGLRVLLMLMYDYCEITRTSKLNTWQ